MDAWSELFRDTEFSPRLEAALRASIPEHQAKSLSAGLGEISWRALGWLRARMNLRPPTGVV